MKTVSLLRKLEYKELSELTIDGKILDLGGDRRSGYHQLINGDHQIVVVNINKDSKADINFNLEDKFSIESNSYEAVLCINVLEHIFNYQNVIDESHRVLKDNGQLIGVVPFLLNVHGSPEDYFRYTKSALEKILAKPGFTQIKIKELGTGLFSVIYQLKFDFFLFKYIKLLAMHFCMLLDKLLIHKIIKHIKPNNRLTEKNMPLGYFFIAKK